MARIVNYGPDAVTHLPVSGGGSALAVGALLKRGATPASMNGHLRLAGGTGGHPDIIGILREAHAVGTDTDVAGTVFTTHPVQMLQPFRVVRIEYSLATADTVVATQAVSTTALTLTNLEDDIDAAFLYVAAGLGIGQTNYLTASAAGSATLKAAFGTSLDTTSRLVKILPRFHPLVALTSDGTKLTSTAAAGATTAMVYDNYIEKNNRITPLNPVRHSALTAQNGGRGVAFWADVVFRDTMPYTID